MKKYIMFFAFLTCFFLACNKQYEIPIELVKSYNIAIQKAEEKSLSWVNSPILIALELSGATKRSTETKIQIKMLNRGEKPTKVFIKIQEYGVFDDSKDEDLYYFFLKRDSSDNWRVVPSLDELDL